MERQIEVCDRATIQWYGKSQDVGMLRVHILPYVGPDKYSFSCMVVDLGNTELMILGATVSPNRQEVSQMKGVVRRAGFHTVLWERAPEEKRPEFKYVRLKLNNVEET